MRAAVNSERYGIDSDNEGYRERLKEFESLNSHNATYSFGYRGQMSGRYVSMNHGSRDKDIISAGHLQ